MQELVKKRDDDIFAQATAFSRAVYSMTASARRILAFAMKKVQEKRGTHGELIASFSVSEFFKALNLRRGQKQKALVIEVVDQLFSAVLFMCTDYGWVKFSWCQEIRFSAEDEMLSIHFSNKFSELMTVFKKAFSLLELSVFGKLQSFYAIRYYEIAKSWSGMMGKDGNRENEWFFEYTVDDLRELFDVKEKYKINKDFRIKIIDNPINEINEANIGFRITLRYDRGDTRLGKIKKVRFCCKKVKKSDPQPVDPATDTERLDQKLETLFSEDFEFLFQEEMRQQELEFPDKKFGREYSAKTAARKRLRELHPEVKI